MLVTSHSGKGKTKKKKTADLPDYSSFSTMFSKTAFLTVYKTRDSLLNLIFPFPTMTLYSEECRARSDRSYVQSDLALHSLLLYHLFMSINYDPMPFNPFPNIRS